MIDPTTLSEFICHWDHRYGLDVVEGKVRSWTPVDHSRGAPIVFDTDYLCGDHARCQYGLAGGNPASDHPDGGLVAVADAAYTSEPFMLNRSFYPDMQKGFVWQLVVTVNDAHNAPPSDMNALGNTLTDRIIGDDRGSSGMGVSKDENGEFWVSCHMNGTDLSPKGAIIGPVTPGVRTLLTWEFDSSGGQLSTLDYTDQYSGVQFYRVNDARMVIFGGSWNGVIKQPTHHFDGIIHQIVLMSPSLPRDTWDETGQWLLEQAGGEVEEPPEPKTISGSISITADFTITLDE